MQKTGTMLLQDIINKLQEVFTEAENTGKLFSEEQFFVQPSAGKWSAAENIQHLVVSVKPLVSLFGKPETMLQWGICNRPAMDYDAIVALYKEKLAAGGKAPAAYSVMQLEPTKEAQLATLHSINAKFLERASLLTPEVLDTYQIPHPLLGLLTVKEFLLFTHYHTIHHTETLKRLPAGQSEP